jgi:hypothetical protein
MDFCEGEQSGFDRVEEIRDSVGLAGCPEESVGEVMGGDAILTAFDRLTKLLDALTARFILCAPGRCLAYLVRWQWD